MLNSSFLKKDLGKFFPPYFVYDFSTKVFSCYILVTDQIALPDYLYFLRYWAICALHLFVNQAAMSKILKLTYLSNQAVFIHDQKVKTKT